MKQCLLIKAGHCQIAWLPVLFAVKGKWVMLRDDDGWQVRTVFAAYQENVDVPRGYLSGGVFHR